jgi:hypothetical protein
MRNLLLFLVASLWSLSSFAQTPCNAGFTYSVNGATVTFTNTSTPATGTPNFWVNKTIRPIGGATYWFGSSFTYTYFTTGTFTAVATIEVYDSTTNTIICSDSNSQQITITALPCNVSISKSISGNTVTFTANNLNNTPGMGYSWNFGDGNFGNGSPVSHTYANSGFYHVTLTGSSSSAGCSKTDSTTVSISSQGPNVISGGIIADSTVQDTFKVWLIKFDSTTNNLYAVDSQVVYNFPTQYAPYAFYNKPAGQYRTKAHQIDGPSSGTGYVPTYHLNSLYWNTATLINHTGGNSSNKYILMQTGTVTSGPGFIGGNVSQGANKGTSGGIQGMTILLRDHNGNFVKYATTDANGDYSFTNLPTGSYTVYPEDAGYTTTTAGVTLITMKPVTNNVNFERHNGSKTIAPKNTGIEEVAHNSLAIYPNPSNGLVYVSTGANEPNANVTVADMTGRVVYKGVIDLQSGKASLDLSHLQNGHYIVNIHTASATTTQKLSLEK